MRLRYVRVACGDWSRVVTASATTGFNHVAGGTLTGIFLDPPYHDREYIYDATRTEHKRRTGRQSREATATRPTASREVGRWALRAGRDPRLRLVVCGRRGEFSLDGWRTQVVRQDVLWLSPGCL